MPLKIEQYALIGDTETAGLVATDGSIDWLCFPRFDAAACFAALLGDESHGRWLIAPARGEVRSARRYRDRTLILETTFETSHGSVRVIDFMPPRDQRPSTVRIVEGLSGRVEMRMVLNVRFDYGRSIPWTRDHGARVSFVAGPDALELRSDVEVSPGPEATTAEFAIGEGEAVAFTLTWHRSHEAPPPPADPGQALRHTGQWWRGWTSECNYGGEWEEAVVRSLVTLKALTYAPTGGIVAAPTTSLPEKLGGVRNWDYRFCWLRDAAMTLRSLVQTGFTQEAIEWRDWLLRAVAGTPGQLQMMYGMAGERHLPELELSWLPGYEGAAPVRIGNAAAEQLQLDVFGEVLDAMHQARGSGIEPAEEAWRVQAALVEHLESVWSERDEGIWEVRGPRRHFTHSKVMAWLAFDRAIRAVERSGLDGPVDRWRRCRDQVHAEVCREGYDAERNTFTQYYGSRELDASLLRIPLVGFLDRDDERVHGTIAAIRRELGRDGLLLRYPSQESSAVDGLPPGEGAFLPCSFWLVQALAVTGRRDEALPLFERLLSLRNDVGLLAEEYDPHAKRFLGNFPQAFTHVALLSSVRTLSAAWSSEEPVER